MTPQNSQLGLAKLSAIVFSSVIGIGIFNLAQNMAVGAEVGAVLISWLITGLGILFLVLTFKALADSRPDLDAGIYQYAQVGFGNYAGFNIAWGYWLCTACGNIAYAVMLNDSFAAFWPVLYDHGLPTIIVGSALIWAMYWIVVQGIRTASVVNLIITIIKIVTILMIVGVLILNFKLGIFTSDLWGEAANLGTISDQIKSTMLVTLWCFIGIEGAVVMSGRAKRASDVGKASIIGFILSWVLYVLVSVLCFGVMRQAQMAELPNPSLAYVMIKLCGAWAYYFVIIAVIISLLGGWVAWTLICGQVPYEAAKVGIFPKMFLRSDRYGTPTYGLLVSAIIMQIFILLVVMADSVYMAALEMTGMMVLPSYLFCGLFLLKAGFNPQKYLLSYNKSKLLKYRILGILCTIFCLWMIYSGGIMLLLTTTLFYLPGLYFYRLARRQENPHLPVFTTIDLWIVAIMAACALASIYLIVTGHITL